jgi:hypothetical protein
MAVHGCGRPTGSTGPRAIDVLRRFAPSYLQTRRVPAQVRTTLEVVLGCRTAARVSYRLHCDCGYSQVVHSSCGLRYCSQCQGARRARWADAKGERLLPVPHHQVVTTLPAELRPLMRQFPDEVYDVLFQSTQEMVKKLATSRWGAMPSILSVLHTWSQALTFHPHVHSVVSAGGLSPQGEWVWADRTFLFPTKVMAVLFRGIFLDRLKRLNLPLDQQQRRALRKARSKAMSKRWVVHVEPPGDRPAQHLLDYLARYVYQNAISDHRVQQLSQNTVTISTRNGPITMRGHEFVRRWCLHILPRRFRRIRQYGLLAPGASRRLEQARQLVQQAPPPPSAPPPAPPPAQLIVLSYTPHRPAPRCPRCALPLRVSIIEPALPAPRHPSARGPP